MNFLTAEKRELKNLRRGVLPQRHKGTKYHKGGFKFSREFLLLPSLSGEGLGVRFFNS
jgi:hypothetical protein